MTLRLGLLSTANINRKLLGGVRAAEGVEAVAVASRDQARADAYAAEHGLGRAHGSYEALLADPDVDAVYIPLPNSMHVPWSIRALQAGKHVLCEKPLTRRPEDAQAAFDAAERADRVLAEAFMWRHHPQALRLRELVRDRTVGNLRLIRAAFSFDLHELGNVRLQGTLDGGGLMDVGCYCVSAMRLLAGEPQRVSGRQVIAGEGVDVRFAATLTFEGDVLGAFDCGLDMVDRAELEVIGDAGSLFLADPWHSLEPGIEIRRAGGTEIVERIEIERRDPYACELEDFAAAVRGERPHPFGRDDAVWQARTIAALYRSAEFGAEAVP